MVGAILADGAAERHEAPPLWDGHAGGRIADVIGTWRRAA
jgi:hypothetical protein